MLYLDVYEFLYCFYSISLFLNSLRFVSSLLKKCVMLCYVMLGYVML